MLIELIDGIGSVDLRAAFASTRLIVTPEIVAMVVATGVIERLCVVTDAGVDMAKFMPVIAFTFPLLTLLE